MSGEVANCCHAQEWASDIWPGNLGVLKARGAVETGPRRRRGENEPWESDLPIWEESCFPRDPAQGAYQRVFGGAIGSSRHTVASHGGPWISRRRGKWRRVPWEAMGTKSRELWSTGKAPPYKENQWTT